MRKEAWTRPSSVNRVDDLLPEHLHLGWEVYRHAESVVLFDERRGAEVPLWNSETPPDDPTIEHLVTQIEDLSDELDDSATLIRNATGLS